MGGSGWKSLSDYWIANVDGSWNADQTIEGTVTGHYLSYDTLGSITGDMLGSYDTYSALTWEGVVLGEFTEQPLAFSGKFANGDFNPGYAPFFTVNASGIQEEGNSYRGLLGGTSPPGMTLLR